MHSVYGSPFSTAIVLGMPETGSEAFVGVFGYGWGRYTTALDEISLKGDTIVGTEVWIGIDSMILPGIKLGDGAIIAARSVVSKNIGPRKKLASE